MKTNSLLDNLAIIVVEPKKPGNIGSIARACKNMGINNIILINPVDYLIPETFKLGWGSEEIINNIKVVKRLEDILPNFNLLIGTTQRFRDNQPPFLKPKELVDTIKPTLNRHKVGIIFGRENNGLTNQELQLCNYTSSIPNKNTYPALNLSQAVMIYAYEFFNTIETPVNTYNWDIAPKSEEHLLYKRMEEILPRLPINTKKGAPAFVNLFKRTLGRTCLERRDIRLFFKLFSLIEKVTIR